ncbi:MAG: hybrid sensor histidine kinase/response regulator [Bryobacterales bacterium]|nr:hybrid sensor histidine kinase/response regulator [Bryobacterales bacterium]
MLESTQNLSDFESEMVVLEQNPEDAQLLGSIFRRIHTVKGTCGFFGFTVLEKISHNAENILSQIRAGERTLTPAAATAILKSVDAMRRELAAIEATGGESSDNYGDLYRLFEKLAESESVAEPAAVATDAPPPAPESAPEPEPASAAPADHPATRETNKSTVADSAVRVDVSVLDRLMNLVGELVLTRNQLLQKHAGKGRISNDPALQRLNLLTGELQDAVTRTRMQPVSNVWNKLPRVVRDLASSLGKEIDLQMVGSDTELDRGVLEAIRDPLTHMVRNSCDHGIETPDKRAAAGKPRRGTLRLRAAQEGSQVVIEIADDGAGIDPERIRAKAVEKGLLTPADAAALNRAECLNLIFLPGFSTATAVTNVSGRGVGMDVVKRNIERISGSVELSSEPGNGSQLKIRIPLTLAILPALAVHVGEETLLIPQRSIRNLVSLPKPDSRELVWVEGSAVLRDRGTLLPLVFLGQVLYPARAFAPPAAGRIVIVEEEGSLFGLVVDDVIAMREIVVKPFGRELAGVPCYAGATILGDGRVALVLDIQGIVRHIGWEGRVAAQEQTPEAHAETGVRQTLLLFACGAQTRIGVPLSLVERLEKFRREDIEFSAGKPVLQYRGGLLPLLSLPALLDPARADAALSADTFPAFVVQQNHRRIGVLVDRIVDITSASLGVRGQANGPFLLGSVVVDGKVTDLLNLAEAVQQVDAGFFQPRVRERSGGRRVLVWMPARFERSLTRSYLELGGHEVLEAATEQEALALAAQQPPQFLCCSAEASARPAMDQFLSHWRESAATRSVPVIGLIPAGQTTGEGFTLCDFDARVELYDRKALLAAIDSLALKGSV